MTTKMMKNRKRDDKHSPTALSHNFKFREILSYGLTVMFWVFFFFEKQHTLSSCRGGK